MLNQSGEPVCEVLFPVS